MPEPDVLLGEKASRALARGFDQICEAAGLTLGPAQGIVYSQSATGGAPEAVGDAATLARRIFQLPNRAQDLGAMLARNMIWRTQTRAGDGGATAAVLARELLRSGLRFSAAGGNIVAFRKGVDRATEATRAALRAAARPAEGVDTLRRLAESITNEPGMSAHLAEIFAEIGADAYVRVEQYAAPYVAHEFQAGARWSARLVSQYLITDQAAQTSELRECDVAIYDGDVSSLEEAMAVLELAAESPERALLLVANELSGEALNTLVANHREDGKRIAAVRLERAGAQRDSDYEDLAVFTSARVLGPSTGRALHEITREDLGRATRAIAGKDSLVVMCGEDRLDPLSDHVGALRDRLDALLSGDAGRDELLMRSARLSGEAATLKIGAHTESERKYLQARAEKALRALPLALSNGVLPGGGAAYVHCRPAVDGQQRDAETAGMQALVDALNAPFLRIAANAGIAAPSVLLDDVRRRGAPYGFDARERRVADMTETGILDPLDVLITALETGVSGAMIALTVGAIVLRSNPETTYEP